MARAITHLPIGRVVSIVCCTENNTFALAPAPLEPDRGT